MRFMNFNSFPFLVLLGITFTAYYLPVRARYWQISVLLIASLTFYGCNNLTCWCFCFFARRRRRSPPIKSRMKRAFGRGDGSQSQR